MSAQIYTFGPFRLDVRERQLLRDQHVIPLRRKVFDTLCILVHHAGRLLRKDELMKAIWPDSVVEENNLEHNLCVLRKVLGQNHSGQKLIETVHRQGYRFVAKVHALDEGAVGKGDVASEPPDTLRQFLQEELDQLPPAEQEIVAAASVAGIEFCVSSVAGALNRPGPDVEMQCAAMAQAGRFFATCGWSDWLAGTVCQRYRFIHSLDREVIYQRLPAYRRTRWHLRIGERMECAAGARNEQAALDLALHFRQGRDARRAIHYLKQATQLCLERGAMSDAVLHLTSGLELLRRIPDQKERKRLALELRGQYRKARALMDSRETNLSLIILGGILGCRMQRAGLLYLLLLKGASYGSGYGAISSASPSVVGRQPSV